MSGEITCQQKRQLKSMDHQKKKKINDYLTLVKFIDVGINEEGYCKYNQIVLHVEDVYDAVSVKFNADNNVDFILMMDYSQVDMGACVKKC